MSLEKDTLDKATALLTSALNYNAAIQTALVSTDNYVTATLYEADGVTTKTVQVPTYAYLLKCIKQMQTAVDSMQVSDDGQDVVQLLTTANNVRLLYLKKQQYYASAPVGGSIIKFDYAKYHSVNNASNDLAMYFDLSGCKIPMDAQIAVVQLDSEDELFLPILSSTKTFEALGTILRINADGSLLLDNAVGSVGDTVQIKGCLYTIDTISGSSITVSTNEFSALAKPTAGDTVFNITGAILPYIEVPITNTYSKMKLSIQYMQMRSRIATYDISSMVTAIHATTSKPITEELIGNKLYNTLSVMNSASFELVSNYTAISAIQTTILDTTVRQVNTHQYVNSDLETLIKANAVLVQAESDIKRLQTSISAVSNTISNSGSSYLLTSQLDILQQELSSATARYNSATTALSELKVAQQDVQPRYEMQLTMSDVDSNNKPVVQFVARFQRLSYNVSELSADWQYAYSLKRSVDANGVLAHDIDNYATLNKITIPIYAYEQVAVQVCAVLTYGQPFKTITTAWSATEYVKVPDELLKETTIAQVLQNTYAARLNSDIQAALSAAGVVNHIKTGSTFMHNASDVAFSSTESVLSKLTEVVKTLDSLKVVSDASSNLEIYIEYVTGNNATLYPVTNNSQINLTAKNSYYKHAFVNDIGSNSFADMLGHITTDTFNIIIKNNSSSSATLHTILPGQTSDIVQLSSYRNIPIHAKDKTSLQTYGLACYRKTGNSINNRLLVTTECFNVVDGDVVQLNQILPSVLVNVSPSNNQDVVCFYRPTNDIANTYQVASDYDGIGIHSGYNGNTILANYNNIVNEAKTLCKSLPYGLLKQDYVQPAYIEVFDSIKTITKFDAKHKFLSGKHSRGASMYIAPNAFNDIALPTNGTSNTISINAGSSITIPCEFQARMSDRLGLTDTQPNVYYLNNALSIDMSKNNFAYNKTMNLNIQIGVNVISFDVTMTKYMFD
jgi:hypothetical protein